MADVEETSPGCACESCLTLHEMSVADYVALLGEQVTSEAEDAVRTREAALVAAAELRGTRAALNELAHLVMTNKWLDANGSKEAAWGRAYNEASRELEKKYQPKEPT